MKKIVAIFLLIAIMTVFVSCADNEQNNPVPQLGTNISNTESTTASTEQAGYVLTTDPGSTVYWGITTAFMTTDLSEVTYPSVSIPAITDDRNTTAIIPDISQVTNNNPTTNNSGGNTGTTNNITGPTVSDAVDNTEPGSTEPTTDAVQKQPKVVAVSSSSLSNDRTGKYLATATIDFSSSGWDGTIVSNSGTATVVYGGESFNAPCSVSASSNSQGNYEIVITLTSLEIPAGTDGVTVKIPAGFIQNSAGTIYSMEISRRI